MRGNAAQSSNPKGGRAVNYRKPQPAEIEGRVIQDVVAPAWVVAREPRSGSALLCRFAGKTVVSVDSRRGAGSTDHAASTIRRLNPIPAAGLQVPTSGSAGPSAKFRSGSPMQGIGVSPGRWAA
jgi:hypothetical protein